MIKEFSVIINGTRYDAGEALDVCDGCALFDMCDNYVSISNMCKDFLEFNQHFVEHKDEV
jgi:hypothetical protein